MRVMKWKGKLMFCKVAGCAEFGIAESYMSQMLIEGGTVTFDCLAVNF